ncbi:MAG: AAA family ATPase [Pseudomonadales bacterium]
MSTIEKAAAKLAARKKSAPHLDPGPLQAVEAAETPIRPPPIIQGKTQGFLNAAEHYCDIDLTNLAEKGYLVPGEGRSQLAQEMRRIKRPLLLNIQREQVRPSGGPPANLVMLTSSLPGEGKTFVAINLAISLSAELDRRVLLVDADVSKGGITEQLGIQVHRGLSDLLYETNYVGEDAVLTSNIDRLSILPAGGNSDHIDELYASELMGTITQELALADPDRVVVFDAPPLLATTEAAVLARHMGQVIVVVEADKTPQNAVAHAIAQLQGCANVSMILNKTSQRDTAAYGYGYAQGKRRPAEAGFRDARQDAEVDEPDISRERM